MKQGQWFLMFLTVYTICFLALYVEQRKYDNVLSEKQRVENALLEAACTTARSYEKVINATEEIRKNTVSNVFLDSFYVSMGLFGSLEEQESLRMYLPVIILVEEDGAFFYFMQETKKDQEVELRHVWSEKIQYGTSCEYDRLELIEKITSAIVSSHNYIAAQYGISYQFHTPEFVKDISDNKKTPMLFVVFQGWPLSASGDIIYENCIDAGVYIVEKKLYTVQRPENISNPFYVYHDSECLCISEEESDKIIKNVSFEDTIQKYGAYPCSQCIKE